jgi:hypothetical protein
VIGLAISTGLLLGLALGQAGLPVAASARAAPFAIDMIAAAIAVAAYGTFFSMSWRLLAVPAVVGMAAHGLRWLIAVQADASAATAALLACLLVGSVTAPVADRLRLPFAGLAFASVVSLIPASCCSGWPAAWPSWSRTARSAIPA